MGLSTWVLAAVLAVDLAVLLLGEVRAYRRGWRAWPILDGICWGCWVYAVVVLAGLVARAVCRG